MVCPFCGCLCDDIVVEVEDGSIQGVEKACSIGRSLFLKHKEDLSFPSIDGSRVSLKEAITKAIEILKDKKHVLIYGLSSTSIEAQRKAIELADLIGASIDQTASICHGPTSLAVHQTGIPTCSLGEVKNRADMVVFWGSNPLEAHQRHYERYSLIPKGMFLPDGRRGRKLVVVDVRPTPSSRAADLFVQVKPGGDYEVLNALRYMLRGGKIEKDEISGVNITTLKELLQLMLSAKYGVIFVGMGLTMTRGKYHNVEAAISLAIELNSYTRWSVVAMRGHYNVNGAGMSLVWQTGFPIAVNFSLGYPRYSPGEFSAVDLLRRKEVDAALVIASDPVANFPRESVKNLLEIPIIAIDPKMSLTAKVARVVIPTAKVGIEVEGTAYRMDGVPLRMKKILDSEYPSDEEVLDLIIRGIKGV
ncbi:MAG: formylmethanofuran dehydrogenase subunit [bacterium]|nr:MAG: Formylmethanofuran dehydrogenase subunit B [bacterium 42_11]MDK2870967.1 formylmethanofuran dehydrogenase subunit [bacterium]